MSKKVDILGVKIPKKTLSQNLQNCLDFLKKSDRVRFLVTPNPEIILKAHRNQNYKKILNKADISLPDGSGLMWAGSLLKADNKGFFAALTLLLRMLFKKTPSLFPEKITGVDFFNKLLEKITFPCPIFLLGGDDQTIDAAIKKIESINPLVKVRGFDCGKISSEKNENLVNKINETKAEILVVALGAPKQEIWIKNNIRVLKSVKLAMALGGTLDFLSGKIKRAPKFLRSIGLEWLYRLIKEPSRYKRIINAVFVFPCVFYKNQISKKRSK